MTVDVRIMYECHEFNNEWCHVVGVICLHASGIKTAGWSDVVLVCNASEWLWVSCPTALTAMAIPTAPAPNITEKWFGSNGLSIYVPENVGLQLSIGLEVYKRLINDMPNDEREMGTGGLRPPASGSTPEEQQNRSGGLWPPSPVFKLEKLQDRQHVDAWLKWAVGCCPMLITNAVLAMRGADKARYGVEVRKMYLTAIEV